MTIADLNVAVTELTIVISVMLLMMIIANTNLTVLHHTDAVAIMVMVNILLYKQTLHHTE